jgi:hypothetical protein
LPDRSRRRVAPTQDQVDFWYKNRLNDLQWHWALQIFDGFIYQGSEVVDWAHAVCGITPIDTGIVTIALVNAINIIDSVQGDAWYRRLVLEKIKRCSVEDRNAWLDRLIYVIQLGEHPD